MFTPLELGAVGLTEDEAMKTLGSDAVETYLRAFIPLEWSILHKSEHLHCLAKLVVDRRAGGRVLGMHIACPNAGEVIQGFSAAMNKGITYEVTFFFF